MKSYNNFLIEYDGAGAQARRRNQMKKGMLKPTSSGIERERQKADAAGKSVASKAVADKKLRDAKANTPGKKSAVLNKPSNFTPNNNPKPQRVQGNIVGKGGQMELPLGVKSKPKTPAKPEKFKAGNQIPLEFKAADKGKEMMGKKKQSVEKPINSTKTTGDESSKPKDGRIDKVRKQAIRGTKKTLGRTFQNLMKKSEPIEGENNSVKASSLHSGQIS